MTSAERIGELLFKYTRRELSRAETEELSAWRRNSPKNEALFQKETDPEHIRNEMKMLFDAEARAFEKFRLLHPEVSEIKPVKSRSRILYITKIAASTITLLGMGLYFLFPVFSPALQPGSYQAELTSFSNISLILNDIERGFLAGNAGIEIIKKPNGELIYVVPNDSTRLKDKYYTLKTPRGGMFSMKLPDGTMIWLNAGSQINYPANFSQDSILITIKGEVYFEVAPQAKVGYVIRTDSAQVHTITAHMNIRAYPGEPQFITLTQGRAMVRSSVNKIDTSEVILSLADRSSVNIGQLETKFKPELIPPDDVQDAVAWKNGRMSFHNVPIQRIMQEISRWYNAKVVYASDIPDKSFCLDLPRDAKFTKVVEALHEQGVHITTEQRNVIVSF